MSDIRQFRVYVSSKMINIPDFINTSSSLHYLTWGAMCEINNILLRLITNSVLREATVCRLVEKTNQILDDMYDIIPPSLQLNVITYLSTMRLWLEKLCINNEFFEAAANLKKYESIYYQNNPIK